MKHSILKTILAVALGMGLIGSATASPLGTIRADHDSSAFGFVDIKYSVTSLPSVSGNTRAGAFLMKQLPDQPGDPGFGFDPLPGPNDPNFYAFCIELHDFIADGVLYDVVDLKDGRTNPNTTPVLGSIGQDRANLVRAVLGSAGFVNFNAPLQAIGSYSLAVTSAAIQVAIWEVIYETLDVTDAFATMFNVSSGVAQFGNGQNSGAQAQVKTLANSILSGLSPTILAPDILALNSKGNRTVGNSQDLIIQIPTPGNEEPVPEPATLGLMGLGLLAVGYFRKRAAA